MVSVRQLQPLSKVEKRWTDSDGCIEGMYVHTLGGT